MYVSTPSFMGLFLRKKMGGDIYSIVQGSTNYYKYRDDIYLRFSINSEEFLEFLKKCFLDTHSDVWSVFDLIISDIQWKLFPSDISHSISTTKETVENMKINIYSMIIRLRLIWYKICVRQFFMSIFIIARKYTFVSRSGPSVPGYKHNGWTLIG